MLRHHRPGVRRAAALSAIAAAVAALAPATAGAWERPSALSPPASLIDGPYLAVDASGDALLAWTRGRAATEEWGLPPAAWVEAASRPAGAPAWSAVQRLSPAGELALQPVVVMPPSGGAVRWTRVQRGILDVTGAEAAAGPAGWSFRPLDMEDGVWVARASATGQDGTLAVTEEDPWQERPELRVRLRSPDGAWSGSAPVEALDPESLQVVLPAGGPVLVASLESTGEWGSPAARTRIVSRAWDPGAGAWGAAERSPEIRGAGADLRVVAASGGAALAAVVVRRGAGFDLLAATRGPGGAFGPARVLGRGVDTEIQAATSPTGEAVVAWSAENRVRLAVRRAEGGWSAPESAPPGVCVTPQSVAALAAGPSGETLVVAMAGYANDWHPGMLRAWVRRPDGAWTGPVWLSRPLAGSPVAAIDGAGVMHVAWTREGRRLPVVEVTDATAAGAATGAVPADPVATVSQVRVSGRGRTRVVRFRLSRRAFVTVTVQPVRARAGAEGFLVTVPGRRGANAVPVRPPGATRTPRGAWTVTVQHQREFIGGCPATSTPFRVR